jgi:DNA adenine methylase
VWRVVLNGQAEWLAKQILQFDLTLENVTAVLKQNAPELREKAFQTILRNRVQRGGIMADGAGLIKTGESGRGLNSRWYPETLARRIREINQQKDRMTFVEDNGFNLIEEHKADTEAAFYIDPPYTLAARRLYKVWQIDHARLFAVMAECRGDFLMSYDNTAEIAALAKKHGFESRPIAPSKGAGKVSTHLLIGKKLSAWLTN